MSQDLREKYSSGMFITLENLAWNYLGWDEKQLLVDLYIILVPGIKRYLVFQMDTPMAISVAALFLRLWMGLSWKPTKAHGIPI